MSERSPRSFWAEHAWVDPSVPAAAHPSAPGTGELPTLRHGVRIVVTDGYITAVTTGVDPAPDDVRLPGVTFPGFANAHSHAFHRALRGRTHGDGGTFWTWRNAMYALAERLTPDTYYALARAVYAEMALAGFTAVGEFHYLHHAPDGASYANPNAMGSALAHAAADAGIRLTLLDTCYLRGGFDTSLEGPQRRFGDGSVDRWIARVEDLRPAVIAGDPSAVVGAAVHSVRTVSEPDIRAVAGWARSANVPLHVHVSEQVQENESCLAAYGRTPARVLADAGALGPGTTAVHATHLDSDDIRLLGESGTAGCACPTTEQDLADGIGPMRELSTAGSPICLGSDQHVVVDPLAEARLLEMHERLASGRRGNFSPAELVGALTRDGYAALGRSQDGSIAPGRAADVVTIDANSVRGVGSQPEQLVFSAAGVDVRSVIVGGETIVDRGIHRLGDVTDLLRESIEAVWNTPF
ncbi:formimidoylglutamate deiminase [Actinobacteria bacterium YIM 96077]|uniref:Formimidoylglutamate deiminase n=1 Tax=Phytoactinopolyspora halophila TaxID=1981511 RepID=A0A329R608_9ACTN|nr:formimidoylglutamate deiminase [Phytoactinopolyspora halophila]AYY11894.1 formimidoylglutamate deiminase [Actinobacteria bacterium YIM 96077]RAW18872.1 formimidoylglutamate deiminase [Phytoactinopolyspora halophila]